VSDILLSVEDLGKAFPPPPASAGRLKAVWNLLTSNRMVDGECVLDEVSFDILRGESMALIGTNGAGKSTLLKMITGVQRPSRGKIAVHGRISALLELGAGFEPDYTGLENLRMNAALLGLSPDQIRQRLDDILAFADLGEAIHKPIRHYSSGMVVRLGFAIAASVRPDLLITDEVLAVGDESFQKKCIRWVERYLEDGGTLLMVSHNMYQVQKLCRHALWLHHGRIHRRGDVFDVTQAYLAWHERKDNAERVARSRGRQATARVEAVALLPSTNVESCASFRVEVELSSPDGRPPVVLVGLVRADGTPVYGVASEHDGFVPRARADGRFVAVLEFPELSLLPGGYVVRAHAMDPEGLRVHDTFEEEFTVRGRSRALGLVHLPHRWAHPED